MDKIICDICGTTYPSSADCCPICGFTNTDAAELLNEDALYEEVMDEAVAEETAASAEGKKIFDFDEVNPADDSSEVEADDDAEDIEEAEDDEEDIDDEEDEDDDEDEDDEEDDEEEAPRHNTFVVILLTVIIVALLGAAGFIFVRYFLPNMGEETVPATTAVQEVETTAATTEPTIPCQQMAMTNAGIAELSAQGQQFLLHVKALPENTTDRIVYTSEDETIATVTEDGKITAVAEGETVIHITCGKTSMKCPVIVKFVEETVPATTEAVVGETESAEETEETSETEANAEAETEAVDETEAKADEGLKNVKLKLKRTDIQLGVYYSFRLELDCDLDPEEVTWTSEHPHIATVDETGSVTAVKSGTTSVTAKYGDQEVSCMVRCIWY